MTNTKPDLDRRVAEWMGWVENKKYGFWLASHYSSKGIGSPSASHNACALVKARLVERGWILQISLYHGCCSATVMRPRQDNGDDEINVLGDTEPEAIALLACKVAEWEMSQEKSNG